MKVIEVEVFTPSAGSFYCPHIKRAVRSRIDFHLLGKGERNALQLSHEFPQGVPGQILGVDIGKAEGYIREPLHDAAWAELRAKLAKRGFSLAPAQEAFPIADANDVATWIHWLRRCVDDGCGRLVRGEFPDKLPGTPRREFRDVSEPDSSERTVERLVAILLATLTPEQRARADELLGV
jgi:hypothetical protein